MDRQAIVPPRRVVVMGAGAIGSLIGGKLAHVMPVALIGRAEHMAAIQSHGLRLEGHSRETIPCGSNFQAATSPYELAPPIGAGDLCVLAVKAAQAARAAGELRAAVSAGQPPLPLYALQNGTGYEAALRAATAPILDVFRAVVHLGATYAGPGRVEDWGGEILLSNDVASAALKDKLNASGLQARTVQDLEAFRWQKIAFNCALNALAGVFEVRNRETITKALRPIRRAVLDEAREVATTLHVQLSSTDELLAEFEARAQASNNMNSLLQDLQRGRPTEVAYLNAAILAAARAQGRDAPVNGVLADWVSRLERATPGPEQRELRSKAQTEVLALAGARALG